MERKHGGEMKMKASWREAGQKKPRTRERLFDLTDNDEECDLHQVKCSRINIHAIQ